MMATSDDLIEELERALQRERLAHIATVLAAAGYMNTLIEDFRTAYVKATFPNLFQVTCACCGVHGFTDDEQGPDVAVMCPHCSARSSIVSMGSA
jgi:hypothetical protein